MKVIYGGLNNVFCKKHDDDIVFDNFSENALRKKIGLPLRCGYVESLGLNCPAIMQIDETVATRILSSVLPKNESTNLDDAIFKHILNINLSYNYNEYRKSLGNAKLWFNSVHASKVDSHLKYVKSNWESKM